jgi:YggT family protein
MYLASIIHTLFVIYAIFIFLRIVSSWFPEWQAHNLVRFVAFYTDPYLNLFRRILPPLGGVLDISPILAFFVLKILERVLLSLVV